MSKKSGKELHPLYQSWYHARRTQILCEEWKKDFWLFVDSVKERPLNTTLKRIDKTKLLNLDNFKWELIKQRLSAYEDRAAYMREYRAKNPNIHKNLELKKSFGITLEDYNNMLKAQNNVCAICSKPETTYDSKHKKVRSLSVDHCHTTGKVRGLLCAHCNHAIGKFNDDISLIQNAINYLTDRQ